MRDFLLLIALVFPFISAATQQIEDVLVFNNNEYGIEQTPLSSAMSDKIIAELIVPQTMCSASWRGYKAKWKIENKMLYLVEIRKDPCFEDGKNIPVNVLFPKKDTPVKASWFSGRITSRTGKWLGEKTKHESGATIIANYKYELVVFEILKGILIDKRIEVTKIE